MEYEVNQVHALYISIAHNRYIVYVYEYVVYIKYKHLGHILTVWMFLPLPRGAPTLTSTVSFGWV